MRDINKKFSVRYYLNLVLIDEEERRYFKQQVTQIGGSRGEALIFSCCPGRGLANVENQWKVKKKLKVASQLDDPATRKSLVWAIFWMQLLYIYSVFHSSASTVSLQYKNKRIKLIEAVMGWTILVCISSLKRFLLHTPSTMLGNIQDWFLY